MGNEKLTKLLSTDVKAAYDNITATKKELGGGKSKKDIDSSTEYRKLEALIAGAGEVKMEKMTKTDLKTLGALLANAEKWKPVTNDNNFGMGDILEKTVEKNVNEDKKSIDKKENSKTAENKTNVGKETSECKPKENEKPQDKNRLKENKPLPPKSKSSSALKFESTTNNSGINNSFNGNSGTIIIDNSVHIGAAENSKANPPKSKAKPSDNAKKEDAIRKNKENYQTSFAEGESVADDLIGPTIQKEKIRAIRNIMKQNENTIIGFMEGFYSNDTVLGIPNGIGDLLDLIDNEGAILFDAKWTDSEKQRVFAKVMESTLKYAKNTGNTENSNYKELTKLLQDVKAGKQINTETADAYIKELITAGAIDVNS